MVSSPTFNPSDLVGRSRSKNFVKLMRDPLKPLLDRPLMARYPPGSTFKLTNALIFQQEGIITPQTTYPCHGGFIAGRLHVGCHIHPSPLNMYEGIEQSCNGYFCGGLRSMLENSKYGSVADAFDVWKKYTVQFGFGYKLGVDFPNENRGFIPNREYYNKIYGKNRWRSLTVISIAIGQGEVLSTPIQTANAAAIIANRGYWIRPHVVKRIQGLPLDTTYSNKQYVSIDPKYFETVIKGMEMVVTDGTGQIAQIKDVVVCGKTGTAQNPHGRDHSIFMAFAPKDHPKIAIAVFVENAGFGAAVAAPIASLMMEKYLKGSIDSTRIDLQNRISNENFLPFVKAN
jgi:penicillin-binding protein 2